jgi:hypothetical protein
MNEFLLWASVRFGAEVSRILFAQWKSVAEIRNGVLGMS